MIGLLFGFMSRVLVGTLLFSLALFFFGLAASLRLLPRLIEGVRRVVRGGLILSYRFYRMTFLRLQPFVFHHLGVDILSGHARLVACILISLAFGVLLLIFIAEHWVVWILGFAFLHGLFVGLAWEDIENPGGIQLGVER